MRGAVHPNRSGKSAAYRRQILIVAAASVLALAACDRERRPDDVLAVGLNNPELRHPIHFDARVETLDVEVPPDAEGLSPNQNTDVFRFLKLYKREANSRLIIAVPGDTRPSASIAQSLQGIQRQIVEAGIDYRLTRGKRVPRPRFRPSASPTGVRWPCLRPATSGARMSGATRRASLIPISAVRPSATSPSWSTMRAT